jgi:hypothetical protein
MKKKTPYMNLVFLLTLCLSACIPVAPPVQNQVSEAYIKTAVASTLVAERAKEAGAALSISETPEGGATVTPEVEATEEGEASTEPEPTVENPWMLQVWCVDHPDKCHKYAVRNTTDSWLQIELKKSDTGVTGFFTVQKKTTAEITLIPGQYDVKYTWWCEDEAASLSLVKSLGSWIDVFSCPKGFVTRENKP